MYIYPLYIYIYTHTQKERQSERERERGRNKKNREREREREPNCRRLQPTQVRGAGEAAPQFDADFEADVLLFVVCELFMVQ